MTVPQIPVVKRYLEQFRNGLSRVPQEERDELVQEIESHIAEATGAGKSLADVLAGLGPAERLARAYSAELLLRPDAGGGRLMRWFAVAGVLATTSLPSLIVIPLLGGIGFGFTVGGVVAVLGGIVAVFVPGVVQTTVPIPESLHWVLAMVVGLVLAAMGLGTLALLRHFFRFVIGTIRRVLSH